MLPKSERLTKEDFQGVHPKVFYRGNLFEVGYSPSESMGFACIISKKKIATAVGRNAVKRKVYSILEKNKPIKTGNFFFYIKSVPKDTPASEFEKEINDAFATLH